MSLVNVLLSGVFHAAVLFLVAAGLQLVFGVCKVLNLACGSFYALGAYTGISAVQWALAAGLPPVLFLPVLVGSGLLLAVIGLPVERLLRPIYDRDESFQLLLTFALVLMFEDVIRFVWRYYQKNPEFITLLNTENLHRGRHIGKSLRAHELSSPVIDVTARVLVAGVKQKLFRGDLAARDVYLMIAAMGYFYLSNRYTLSAFLGESLDTPAALAHWETFMIDAVLRKVSAAR